MPIRVALVDDHLIVLHGLKQLFEQNGFEVVCCSTDAESALDAVRLHRPDVLVLDVRMPGPGGGGLQLLAKVSDELIECRSVILTAAIGHDQAAHAVRLGARGLVLKESPPETLLDCVRSVHAGQRWIQEEALSPKSMESARNDADDPGGGRLTPREVEIVRMAVQGLRNKVIAARLSISEGTVKVHLHHIYEKLGVGGRLELVVTAAAKGIR